MCCGTPLTEPRVPTGIKTGVSISPCGVRSWPRRAGPSLAEMEKERDMKNRVIGPSSDRMKERRESLYRPMTLRRSDDLTSYRRGAHGEVVSGGTREFGRHVFTAPDHPITL